MKKFLKILFYLIIIIGLYSVWGIILTNKDQTREAVQSVKKFVNPPCRHPLEYSIGEVDPQFRISRDDFIGLVQEAEIIWEDPTGKNLFQYNPNAQFKINLIYDERQEATKEAEKIEKDLNNLEIFHESIAKQYKSLSSVYQKKADEYEKDLTAYKKQLNDYNKEVNYWNDKGGAPQDEYEKLQEEKKDLKAKYADLEKQRKEMNELIGQTNNLAEKENQVVNQYNSGLVTYKSKFGDSREFEKGIFNGGEIDIYQFKEKTDLELTLSHELGHYLGLGHVENPEAVMYYLIGEQDLENPRLAQEDVDVLNNVCKLNN